MQTDVKGANCPASTATTVYNGRARLKGIWYSASAATTIAVGDGSTNLFTMTLAAGNTNTMWIPGEGVLCMNSLVVTVGASCTAVAFYG